LAERADIFRNKPDPKVAGRTTEAIWRRNVPCLLEPISAGASAIPFALESSHVVFVPAWLHGIRKEDEIRIGGHINLDGVRLPNRYIVTGVRSFQRFGSRHFECFCKQRR
jgi:hypothetical protein